MKLTNLMNEVSNSDFMFYLNQIATTYFVGGCCRDLYLNKIPKDIDILVCGIDEKMLMDILREYGKINAVGESFGCYKFEPYDIILDEPIDFVLARKEVKNGDGHKGFGVITDVSFTVFDDLRRRDFTFNAIAIDTDTYEIIDPYNGISDITNKIIRHLTKSAFIEDPLRIIRGLQFKARFGFEIHADTLEIMIGMKHRLSIKSRDRVSGERILLEIKKVFDKNGDMTGFINDFKIFGEKIFGTKCLMDECEHKEYNILEDFVYDILLYSGANNESYRTVLKPCRDSIRLMSVLWMLNGLNDSNTDEMIIRSYTKDVNIIKSARLTKAYIDRFDFLVKNNLPKTIAELDSINGINGITLMSKGFKGRALGDELRRNLYLHMRSMD